MMRKHPSHGFVGQVVLLLVMGLFVIVSGGGCALFKKSVVEEPPVEDEVPDDDDWAPTPPIPRSAQTSEEAETASPDFERAPPRVEESIEDGADLDPAARRAFEAAVLAAKQGDLEASLELFEDFVRRHPGSKWAWYNLGLVRSRAGDNAAARDAWRKALEIDSAFSAAAANIARTMVNDGALRDAERMLRERIQMHPEDLDLRNELARVMIAQGTEQKLDGAFAEARQVLSTDEQNVGALLVLGQVFYLQGKSELAEWVVDRVLAHEPRNPDAHHLMGFLRLRQGQRREAFSSFRSAAAADGEAAEMYVNYGAFLNQAQDFDLALEQLQTAVRLAPRMPEARLNLGNAYRGLGRYQEALAEYELARELDPESSDALLNMALVYFEAPLEGIEILARLLRARELFAGYSQRGGKDDRLGDFMRDVERAIGVEERRVERESLRQVQDAEREAARLAADEAKLEEEAERSRREAEEAFRARHAAEQSKDSESPEEPGAHEERPVSPSGSEAEDSGPAEDEEPQEPESSLPRSGRDPRDVVVFNDLVPATVERAY